MLKKTVSGVAHVERQSCFIAAWSPYSLAGYPGKDELLEVLDEKGTPLLLMPRPSVLRQNLPRRTALAALRDREGKIYLRRPQGRKSMAGLWDISAARLILACESAYDAAMRAMRETLGLEPSRLENRGEIRACPDTDWNHILLFVSAPSVALVNPPPGEACDGMFVDREELEALRRHMPELLSLNLRLEAMPELLFAPMLRP
jgi:hypothetical protein